MNELIRMSKGRMTHTSADMGKLQQKDVYRPGYLMLPMNSHHIGHVLVSTHRMLPCMKAFSFSMLKMFSANNEALTLNK